jgi:hypothetical protein
MSLSYYGTGAAFQVPSEGPDGSDGSSASFASTVEEAKSEIRQAYREFHDATVASIEVLPMAKGRQLLVVYEADDNVDPQLLVFAGDPEEVELTSDERTAEAS